MARISGDQGSDTDDAPWCVPIRRMTRASGIPKMKAPVGNNTVEDAIIIEVDEPLMEVKEEPVDMMNIDPHEPSSSSCPPQSRGGIVPLPHSGRVIFTPAWFTPEGVVPEQLRIPFSVQIEGLDFLNTEISVSMG
ncbi:hypothetical protein AMTRI_Chr07g78770 [Amborella trichopoda]|uniref:uncharacterized protein LOC110006475 n=1 Tax=Amborella trichopoda TaxID=13333 RepID=UPI0009BFEF3E|nr:uncharacterized protein LOC110006475 [Amborella trichopoda]|eukprot:XP_020517678.1 uncharacterized protein LOC110006475 [Amborella trichopoda]